VIVGKSLAPFEWNCARSISALLHQRLVKVFSGLGVYNRPTRLTIVLQTNDIGAKERRLAAIRPIFRVAIISLAQIANLIVQDVGLHFGSFFDLARLKLNEAPADGCHVTRVVRERDPAGSFRVFQLGVDVYARVAHASVVSLHDHRQLSFKKTKILTHFMTFSLNTRPILFGKLFDHKNPRIFGFSLIQFKTLRYTLVDIIEFTYNLEMKQINFFFSCHLIVF
jgi:hypothetical protein